MKRVFVVNKSSHDYSQAENFGKLIFMSEGSLRRLSVSKMYRTFEPYIRASNKDDYILLSGLTVMCSIACAMFASKHKRVNLLIYKADPANPGSYVERITVMENL